MVSHLVIPDVQAEPGIEYPHMEAAGRLANERQPELIIQLGDLKDFKSISSYDHAQTKAEAEYDVREDIDAGNAALEAFMRPIREGNRSRNHRRRYKPRLVYLLGNHEDRLTRYLRVHTELRGLFSTARSLRWWETPSDLFAWPRLGWEVVPFLREFTADGIGYVHFVKIGATNNGLSAANAARKCMRSITCGHRQSLDYHVQHTGAGRVHSLVAGSFYEHHMSYSAPHYRDYWRGLVYKHDVRDGEYSPEFMHIDSLLRRYGS